MDVRIFVVDSTAVSMPIGLKHLALAPVKHLIGIVWNLRSLESGIFPPCRNLYVDDELRMVLHDIVVSQNQVDPAPFVELHRARSAKRSATIDDVWSLQHEVEAHVRSVVIKAQVGTVEDLVVRGDDVLGEERPLDVAPAFLPPVGCGGTT